SALRLPLQNEAAAPSFTKSAQGIRYIFATECSNPAATKVAIGGTIAGILSAVVRALEQSHTARQTSGLPGAARAGGGAKPGDALGCAMARAAAPTAPPPCRWAPARKTSPAVATAPTRLPR